MEFSVLMSLSTQGSCLPKSKAANRIHKLNQILSGRAFEPLERVQAREGAIVILHGY
jgi:hypothetical protein